jgi:hypothetical protein
MLNQREISVMRFIWSRFAMPAFYRRPRAIDGIINHAIGCLPRLFRLGTPVAERRPAEPTKAAPAPAPATTLSEVHPAPWSYREEQEGHPVPWHYQEEPDVYTDDARRRHVVRDARSDVVVECVKFSKHDEEKLARVIASIPKRKAEIRRLRAALIGTLEINRIKALQEMDSLRARNAELEAIVAKLTNTDALPATPLTSSEERSIVSGRW